MTQADGDPGLYIKHLSSNNHMIIVLVYVDDILIAARTKSEINWTKSALQLEFSIHDLGPAKWFLGIRIKRNREMREVIISQERYVEHILRTFGMEDCKARSVPFQYKVLDCKEYEKTMKTFPYRELIGAVMYLATTTRPDIMWSVSYLSRFVSKATAEHWIAAKGLLRYLKGTKNLGIKFSGGCSITGYVDADWAGDTEQRKSTGGYVFKIGTGLFSWQSKLQSVVAASSTEAEYIAVAQAVREALWIRKIAYDLKILPQGGILLKCGNTGALSLSRDNIISSRSKHIDVTYHLTRDYVSKGAVRLEYLSTDDMIADMMTKPLTQQKLLKHRTSCGMCDSG